MEELLLVEWDYIVGPEILAWLLVGFTFIGLLLVVSLSAMKKRGGVKNGDEP